MSTCDRMQFTHILEGLGGMDTPQRQHNLQAQAIYRLQQPAIEHLTCTH